VKRYRLTGVLGKPSLKLSATDALKSTDRAGIRAAILSDVPLEDQPAAEKHTAIVHSRFKLHYRGGASSFAAPPRKMTANDRDKWVKENVFDANSASKNQMTGFAISETCYDGGGGQLNDDAVTNLGRWTDFLADPRVEIGFRESYGLGLFAKQVLPAGQQVVRGCENSSYSQPGYTTRKHGTTCGPTRLANSACSKHSNAVFTGSFCIRVKAGHSIKPGAQVLIRYDQGDVKLACLECAEANK
jgi:hypothetical protein